MLYFGLALIFFALLAVAYELHNITSRIIEIGTIFEHFNRRDMRAAGLPDVEGDDFARESIRKTQRPWWLIVVGIVAGGLLAGAFFNLWTLLASSVRQ